jgi:hypothetical protein
VTIITAWGRLDCHYSGFNGAAEGAFQWMKPGD